MSTRRSLAGGAVLALLGAAGASAAPMLGEGADAELIRLCGEFEARELLWRDAINAAKTEAEYDRASEIDDANHEQQVARLARIHTLPCTTHAGLVAVAGALAAWDAELLADEDDENEEDGARLIGAIVRSLLAGRT